MKKASKWEKPEVEVLKRGKQEKATASSRMNLHYNLGVGPPAPPSSPDMIRVNHSLGIGPPAPTPSPFSRPLI